MVDSGWSLLLFVGLTAVLHVAFVWWRPRTKVWWKKADYVWLLFALLGVIGSFAKARQVAGAMRVSAAEDRVSVRAEDIQRAIQSGISSAICRRFVRTEFSPPDLERIQSEYDAQCAWFRSSRDRLGALDLHRPLSPAAFGGLPPEGGEVEVTRQLMLAIAQHADAANTAETVKAAQQSTDVEITLQILGPFLTMLALALRITKVSGEVRLERSTSSQPAVVGSNDTVA